MWKYHATTVYCGTPGKAPQFINFGSRWRWLITSTFGYFCYVEVTPTSFTLDRTLVGPQHRSGNGDKDRPAEKENPAVQAVSNYNTQEAVI